MRATDFFAGLGGFTCGARATGVDVVLAVNHDERAVHWHATNHPDVDHLTQDLGELDMRVLEPGGLLIASPECQGFTPSGRPGRSKPASRDRIRREGRRLRARSTSYAVLAACDVARPRRVIVENVVEFFDWGLYGSWRAMLEAMGYAVREHRIRADAYGGASERLRAILTASLDGPIDLAPSIDAPAQFVGDCLLADDDPRCRWGPIEERSPSIRERMRAAQRRAGSRVTWANVDHAVGRGEGARFATFTTRSLSQLFLLDGDRCRRLEARELARGMGFPDSYKLPEERSAAGRLIGNAIDCSVARGVVEQVVAA